MSDTESSICQSPSWEGYGQRQKEKKEEARQRRREKEQAGRDARAARKRHASRLMKSPPNSSKVAGVGRPTCSRPLPRPLGGESGHSAPTSSHHLGRTWDAGPRHARQASDATTPAPVSPFTVHLRPLDTGFIGGRRLQQEQQAAGHRAIQEQTAVQRPWDPQTRSVPCNPVTERIPPYRPRPNVPPTTTSMLPPAEPASPYLDNNSRHMPQQATTPKSRRGRLQSERNRSYLLRPLLASGPEQDHTVAGQG